MDEQANPIIAWQQDRWLIARTHRAKEEHAAQHATRQGCQCFLPLIYSEVTKHESPFFPSYLFIRTPTPSVAFLESTHGISSLLRFGATVATILDSELEGIFARSELIGSLRALRIGPPGYQPGELLRVRCGAYMGTVGEFQMRVPGNRIALLIECLGRKTRHKLPEHWVEAA